MASIISLRRRLRDLQAKHLPRKDFATSAERAVLFFLIAFHLGRLQLGERYLDGFVRGLGYESSAEFRQDADRYADRYWDAVRRLLALAGYDVGSPNAVAYCAAVNKLIDASPFQLPPPDAWERCTYDDVFEWVRPWHKDIVPLGDAGNGRPA
jgi:hypothetical protein